MFFFLCSCCVRYICCYKQNLFVCGVVCQECAHVFYSMRHHSSKLGEFSCVHMSVLCGADDDKSVHCICWISNFWSLNISHFTASAMRHSLITSHECISRTAIGNSCPSGCQLSLKKTWRSCAGLALFAGAAVLLVLEVSCDRCVR